MILDRRSLLVLAGLAFASPHPVRAREWKHLEWLLDRRRMIRSFTSDPVPDETVERLVHAATRAPSAGHTQPWEFVVVRTAETRRALAGAALGQDFVAEAPVVIVACANGRRSLRRYPTRGELYSVIDTAFASLLLLLAVTEERLGATFVGAIREDRVRTILGLPERIRPLAVIPIGHPAEPPRELETRNVQDVLHRESWKGGDD